jgi:hypothetical protein
VVRAVARRNCSGAGKVDKTYRPFGDFPPSISLSTLARGWFACHLRPKLETGTSVLRAADLGRPGVKMRRQRMCAAQAHRGRNLLFVLKFIDNIGLLARDIGSCVVVAQLLNKLLAV